MILKGPANIPGENDTDSHGGHGPYFVRTLLTKEFDSSLSYVREIVLEPGSSIGVHEHKGDEEIYYVISGKGVMIVDGEEKAVEMGDIVLTKSGSSHGLRNDSGEQLKFFVACAKSSKDHDNAR